MAQYRPPSRAGERRPGRACGRIEGWGTPRKMRPVRRKGGLNLFRREKKELNALQIKLKREFRINSMLRWLFVLTLLSIFIGFALVVSISPMTQAQGDYMWGELFVLPIPLASIVLGIVYRKKGYRCTKSIVAGAIVALYVCGMGLPSLFVGPSGTYDYGYVAQVGQAVGVEMPEQGRITSRDFGTRLSTNGKVNVLRDSHVIFEEQAQVDRLSGAVLEDERWTGDIRTELIGLLPYSYAGTFETGHYDRFMIYNATLDAYNTLPQESGEYKFYYLAYNTSLGTMDVTEYYLTVLV